MNLKNTLNMLAVTCTIAGCSPTSPELTARLYLNMFEIERYATHADPQASLVTTRFRLLERSEVQYDLALSQDQMIAIQTIYKTPMIEIPGISDFIADRKNKRESSSEGDLTADNLESTRWISRTTADFYSQRLSGILSQQQQDRLDQLLIQAHGPVLIMVQTNLASHLTITPEQMTNLTALVHKADQEIIPSLQKFGRGFISGYGPGESKKTREHEMSKLTRSLQQLIRTRDNNILESLTGEQRRQWLDIQGKPLQIEWSPWELMQNPFEKEDS